MALWYQGGHVDMCVHPCSLAVLNSPASTQRGWAASLGLQSMQDTPEGSETQRASGSRRRSCCHSPSDPGKAGLQLQKPILKAQQATKTIKRAKDSAAAASASFPAQLGTQRPLSTVLSQLRLRERICPLAEELAPTVQGTPSRDRSQPGNGGSREVATGFLQQRMGNSSIIRDKD